MEPMIATRRTTLTADNIGLLLRAKYDKLYSGIENKEELLLLNALYSQIKPTAQQIKLFLSLRNQVVVIPGRKYRVDYAAELDDKKYALEFEGGCYSKGLSSIGYRSIAGYKKHVEKYNVLAQHGWFVFRFQNDPKQLRDVWGVILP